MASHAMCNMDDDDETAIKKKKEGKEQQEFSCLLKAQYRVGCKQWQESRHDHGGAAAAAGVVQWTCALAAGSGGNVAFKRVLARCGCGMGVIILRYMAPVCKYELPR